MRITEFAPAMSEAEAGHVPEKGYGPPTIGSPWKAGRFSGRDFALQLDGPLRCPAGNTLSATEERREADGSLRLVYAARISQCRDCPLREPCPWHGRNTTKPRRVSMRLASSPSGSRPAAATQDWSRREHRRACMQLLRHQRVEVTLPQALPSPPEKQAVIL